MKHKNISVISLLLVTILILTACGNKQEPAAASDPTASTAPIGAAGEASGTPTVGDNLSSAPRTPTPLGLTPQLTQGVEATPDILSPAPTSGENGEDSENGEESENGENSENPSASVTPAPEQTPTPSPAKDPGAAPTPALTPAADVTPTPSKKPSTGNTSTPTPTPSKKPSTGNSGKKLLYALADVGVWDAPNYYTSDTLGKLTHGGQYEVLETIKGTTMTWYRISFNGKNGYVETKYLGATRVEPTPTHAPTQKDLAHMIGTGVVWTEVCPEMLTLTNEVRSELGLRPQMWGDKELEEIALARVVDTIEELENDCVHAGSKNYYHKGLESRIGEIFCWGADTCQIAFEAWRSSPGHWASIVSDDSEDEIALYDMTWPDGHEVRVGDIIPGRDSYMVCAHAIFEGHDYWVIVYAGVQRPWPND